MAKFDICRNFTISLSLNELQPHYDIPGLLKHPPLKAFLFLWNTPGSLEVMAYLMWLLKNSKKLAMFDSYRS